MAMILMEFSKNTIVAGLMTAKTVAGISSIQILGDGAQEILNKIFIRQRKDKITSIDSRVRGNDKGGRYNNTIYSGFDFVMGIFQTERRLLMR